MKTRGSGNGNRWAHKQNKTCKRMDWMRSVEGGREKEKYKNKREAWSRELSQQKKKERDGERLHMAYALERKRIQGVLEKK